jgi:hypothetical protein
LRQYLVRPNIGGASGPWILLEGHCSQKDEDAERLGFVKLQCFLLLKEDAMDFVRLMKKDLPRGNWLPDAEEDHYTFAGEVPWCDTFPHNELRTIDFVIGKTTVKVSPKDPRYNLRIALMLGRSTRLIGPTKPPKFEEVSVYKRIPIYVPVRRSEFSSSGSVERPGCRVPAKVLTDCFGLWLNLPTWNMYDQSGRLCTIATAEGSTPGYERYLYIKQDLIDAFLAKQKLAIVWVAWGERQHYPVRHSSADTNSPGYKYFHQVYRYSPTGPKRVY